MRTPEGDRIHEIIRSHIGAEQAISAPDIARALRWKPSREREVRRVISDEAHLWSGILVCSIPGQGYFCAASYEEAEAHDNWLADLVDAARIKQTSFRTACAKMGFKFAGGRPRRPLFNERKLAA